MGAIASFFILIIIYIVGAVIFESIKTFCDNRADEKVRKHRADRKERLGL